MKILKLFGMFLISFGISEIIFIKKRGEPDFLPFLW